MDDGRETLADASEKVVNKALDRANRKRGRGTKRKELSSEAVTNSKLPKARRHGGTSACGAPATQARAEREEELAQQNEQLAGREKNTENVVSADSQNEEEVDWDDEPQAAAEGWNGELTIEVEKASTEKKPRGGRRANAKDKEFAELVHKAHLLCLLARGRLVDAACDDQLLKASIYSMLPSRLSSIDPEKNYIPQLVPLVRWLCGLFRITEETSGESLPSSLASVLAKQSGSEEEVAAVTVALFRALGFKTRYVCVLNVTSLKPDAESLVASKNWGKQDDADQASSSLSIAQSLGRVLANCLPREDVKPACSGTLILESHKPPVYAAEAASSSKTYQQSPGGAPATTASKKRRGDEEFELEMARAIAATGAAVETTPPKQSKRQAASVSFFQGSPNSSIWSRKKGPLQHWAEVYVGDDNSGKWCHVDAARNLIDDAEKVEASNRLPVRYVIAFAGSGAKDVTRRYVSAWFKLAGLRVDQEWWDTCLAPLRRLEEESFSTTGSNPPERVQRENMELQVKSFTEPLPTNQQAYKNHHLYAMERWLTRYQFLYPKGPVLGHCGGNPVYPRTCVQDLHTKERWLREGFAVKPGEEPVKVHAENHFHGAKTISLQTVTSRSSGSRNKQSPAGKKVEVQGETGGDDERSSLLFGKWQTEPWQPPAAVDGVVPKNERGQVEVWSEKCIPPGTVHLRMPRLGAVAQKLGVDYAPAMVGFEKRQGRPVPVFEGIVVCEEFKDAIMEVYRAEEEQRAAEFQRKREVQAAVRWGQLLRSMIVRERLRVAYEGNSTEAPPGGDPAESQTQVAQRKQKVEKQQHVHSFPNELQSYDEETCIRIKRCDCGFELRVEEM